MGESTANKICVGGDESKPDIRTRVWDHLVRFGLALFPLPPHGRIPNFKGSDSACDMVASLDVFRKARNVKIDPDKPLERIRLRTLEADKTLFVPTPRLKTGLLNRIVVPHHGNVSVKVCATSQGVRDHSVPVGLEEKNTSIDLIVVGCVAVSPKGWRIGKGEGFSDLEFAMMTSVYSVDPEVPVVAVVHDCQVIDLAEDLFGLHDLPVDYIATPTRVIHCEGRPPRPPGLIWSCLNAEKLAKIPVLRTVRLWEKKAGKDVHFGDDAPNSEMTKSQAVEAGKFSTEDNLGRSRGSVHKQRSSRVQLNVTGRVLGGRAGGQKTSLAACGNGRERNVKASEQNEGNNADQCGTGVLPNLSEDFNACGTSKDHDATEKAREVKKEQLNADWLRSGEGHDGGPSSGCIFIGNIPSSLLVQELKDEIFGRINEPARIVWRGPAGYAFLKFESRNAAEVSLSALTGMRIRNVLLRVEMAKSHDKSQATPKQRQQNKRDLKLQTSKH